MANVETLEREHRVYHHQLWAKDVAQYMASFFCLRITSLTIDPVILHSKAVTKAIRLLESTHPKNKPKSEKFVLWPGCTSIVSLDPFTFTPQDQAYLSKLLSLHRWSHFLSLQRSYISSWLANGCCVRSANLTPLRLQCLVSSSTCGVGLNHRIVPIEQWNIRQSSFWTLFQNPFGIKPSLGLSMGELTLYLGSLGIFIW